MIIYKATNKTTGKMYIGQTKNTLGRRKTIHNNEAKKYRSPNSAFHKAIRKYGKDDFVWEVICECRSRDEMNEMEVYYIEHYKSHISDTGYNMTRGGDGGSRGCYWTDEQKRLASENSANRGKPGYFKGHKHTKESIEKSTKCGINNGQSKRWIITSPEGIQFCLIGLSRFCKENGLTESLLRKVAIGERKHHKGWKIHEINE